MRAWGAVVAAGARGRGRFGWALLAPCLLACLAGCGGGTPVVIPKPTPTPRPATTLLAPGVRVADSQLQMPAFTVSTSHPLPSGVSAELVVKDVQIDNLLENIAIERQDPRLLQYADSGDWLAAEQGEIARHKAEGLTVLSVEDTFTTVQAGFQPDPNNSAATAAVIVAGTEKEVDRLASGAIHTKTTVFKVLQWLVWSPQVKRYLTCDTAT
ncbi:MAG: hypothetical protein ACYDEA_01995 [Candidatus Dormibacteria bacterium]